MLRTSLSLVIAFFASSFFCQATPISFPQGFVPFSSFYFITAPDQNGYRLVIGDDTLVGTELVTYLDNLPSVSGDQAYQNQPIELAPGLLFSNVLVPTDEERQGIFNDYGGPILNPFTCQSFNPYSCTPFAGHYIPLSLLDRVYAFRLGPNSAITTTPEPANTLFVAAGIAAIAAGAARRRNKARVS